MDSDPIRPALRPARRGGRSRKAGRVLLVVNPRSGHLNSRRVEQLIEEVRGAPWRLEVMQTRRPGDAMRAAAASPADTSLIIAAGGDGTIREVISGVRHRYIPVAVVPLGTANVLATEFNIPRGIKAACGLAKRGRWRPVDLGHTDRGCFLAVAGAGFDAAVVHCFHGSRSRNTEISSYFAPILRTALRYRFPRITVELDGRIITDKATAVAVANTRSYGGPFVVAPNARPDDGLFDVCIFYWGSVTAHMACMAAAMLRNLALVPGVQFARAKRVRCTSQETVPVQLDGDPRGCLPITFEIEPHAVKLISP